MGAIAAQIDLIPDMPPEAAAYLDRQPLWLMIFLGFSPLSGVAGSVALLLQSRWAPTLFLIQIGVLLAATGYELIVGHSPLLTSRWAVASTLFLLAILTAQIAYARYLLRRDILT